MILRGMGYWQMDGDNATWIDDAAPSPFVDENYTQGPAIAEADKPWPGGINGAMISAHQPVGWDSRRLGDFYTYRFKPIETLQDAIDNFNYLHAKQYDIVIDRRWTADADAMRAAQWVLDTYNKATGSNATIDDLPLTPTQLYHQSQKAKSGTTGGVLQQAPGFSVVLGPVIGAEIGSLIGDTFGAAQTASTYTAEVAQRVSDMAGSFIDSVQSGSMAVETGTYTAEVAQRVSDAAGRFIDAVQSTGAPIEEIGKAADTFIDSVQGGGTVASNTLTDSIKALSTYARNVPTLPAGSPVPASVANSAAQGIAASDMLTKAGLAAAGTAGAAIIGQVFQAATGKSVQSVLTPEAAAAYNRMVGNSGNAQFGSADSSTGLLVALVAGLLALAH